MHAAHAQATDSVAARSAFVQVVERLGGSALLMIVVAILVLLLLVLRVIVMVRRERPTEVPLRRRTNEDDSLLRTSIQRPTDWGFDQNKRAAEARSPVTPGGTNPDAPTRGQAMAQWSTTDVSNANAAGVQGADALGRSPVPTQSPYRTSFNPYFKGEQLASGVEVVEVADALLQAELLVQLGDPKQAMTLLSHHIRDTDKPRPATWLMLLNLYQSTGREAQYNALASGFRMLFNAAVPPWATSPEKIARDIETYPQVMARLQTSWPGPQARETVDALLNDDRGGSRQGFSLTAYRELLFLSEILDMNATLAREEDEKKGVRRKLGGFQG